MRVSASPPTTNTSEIQHGASEKKRPSTERCFAQGSGEALWTTFLGRDPRPPPGKDVRHRAMSGSNMSLSESDRLKWYLTFVIGGFLCALDLVFSWSAMMELSLRSRDEGACVRTPCPPRPILCFLSLSSFPCLPRPFALSLFSRFL